mgnify:CR=1 FL=1
MLRGLYLLDDDTALLLGGVALVATHGAFNALTHKKGFLRWVGAVSGMRAAVVRAVVAVCAAEQRCFCFRDQASVPLAPSSAVAARIRWWRPGSVRWRLELEMWKRGYTWMHPRA